MITLLMHVLNGQDGQEEQEEGIQKDTGAVL